MRKIPEKKKTKIKLFKKYKRVYYIFDKTNTKKFLLYKLSLDYKIILKSSFKLSWNLIYNLLKKELKILKKYFKKIL